MHTAIRDGTMERERARERKERGREGEGVRERERAWRRGVELGKSCVNFRK
jgi:hypothetical protein